MIDGKPIYSCTTLALEAQGKSIRTAESLVAEGKLDAIPAAFVRAATTVHRNAFPGQDYGYLFWHRVYQASCATAEGWLMGGNGGNAIVVLPALDSVVVITRTNYNTKGMHQQTTKLIEDQILPALACAR